MHVLRLFHLVLALAGARDVAAQALDSLVGQGHVQAHAAQPVSTGAVGGEAAEEEDSEPLLVCGEEVVADDSAFGVREVDVDAPRATAAHRLLRPGSGHVQARRRAVVQDPQQAEKGSRVGRGVLPTRGRDQGESLPCLAPPQAIVNAARLRGTGRLGR